MAEGLSPASKNNSVDLTHISVNLCVSLCARVCSCLYRNLRSRRSLKFSGATALNVYIPGTMKQSVSLLLHLSHMFRQHKVLFSFYKKFVYENQKVM